jgi:pimeloyl-ACP methyl ester carboxylesterase
LSLKRKTVTPKKRRLAVEIIIYVTGGFLTFFFGVIFVFLSYPALNISSILIRQREAIVGFGLIIPTILAGWLVSLLIRHRGWKAFVPSLSVGFVIASLILICKKYLSWFPDDWLIFTPWGIILVIISAFVGGALNVRGRVLLHSAIILIVFYSLAFGLTLLTESLSSRIDSFDVKIPSKNILLGATLTVPKSDSPSKLPGILLIHGSGKQDRDETFGLFNGTFKEIARFLSENGFVTIRYDKRGVGQSGGDFLASGLYDFAHDAESVFNYLRSREEVDPSQIFLIGHSYGGKVATAVSSKHPDVAGLILLACVASQEPDNLIRQNKFISEAKGESEKERKVRLEMINSWAEKVRNSDLQDYNDYFRPNEFSEQFQKMQQSNPLPPRWMFQAMEFNQLQTLETLKMPILALSGESDWLVPPSETELLEQTLQDANHPNFEVKVFPEVDHHFIRIKSPKDSYKMMSLYSIKDLFREYPISPPVLNKVLNWLKDKTKSEFSENIKSDS